MVKKTDPMGNKGFSTSLLPNFYQTPANKKFLQATIDQLFQPGTVTKVNGYIGRQNSKASSGKDTFIEASDTSRQNYQLEPGITIKDSFGNVTFFKDYIDYINQLSVDGANVSNHARLNKQEFYSWDPHIDWDKFVDFQNYYWLPYGPDTITVYGQQKKIVSAYTVTIEHEGADSQYMFTPNGFTRNPILKLYRGQTYIFEVESEGHPFSIKYERSVGKYNRYAHGVSAAGVETGTITFEVPDDAPSLLYYQSETDINASGIIQIHDIKDNTYINVESDLLGKKLYKLGDGTSLSNGMKVRFGGNVEPAEYATGQYYVEGVGKAIKLIPESILEIIGPYTTAESIKFDSTPFDKDPFSDATGYAGTQDYIVINRASRDKNPWSRYNRWFHKDVISASATYNGNVPNLDQTARAVRPIIEFTADLKLFNFGTTAIADVDLIDTFTNDIYSIIEGSAGYSVDGIDLVDGQRILFVADTDPLVNNKIYKVEFLQIEQLSSARQIHLVEISEPAENQAVLVRSGKVNQGKMFWYNGSSWKLSQQKTNINQNPLFDVVDSNGISYGDLTVYTGSSFAGTKVFSYKTGTGIKDPVLGIPLSYRNVSNIGDIVFNFDLITDSFQYKKDKALVDQSIDVGFLVSHDYAGNIVYENGWKVCASETTQAAVRIYKDSGLVNNFELDIFDTITNLNDLVVKIYVNGKRVGPENWTIENGPTYKVIKLANDIADTDILTIRAFARQAINANGFYEIPVNLQNNPLNNALTEFTLGEVSDHVSTMVDNVAGFIGTFPGANNLRDLGNITAYGTRFVQHSGPASLSIYHITNQSNNVIKSIEASRDDYNIFKRNFIDTIGTIGVEADAVTLVDLVLQKINNNKPVTSSYYFSDMVPYGASLKTDFVVEDYRIKTYALSTVFSLDKLSNKAVGVYLNGTQLVHGKDYVFNNQGFVYLLIDVNNDDTITTYEYENTDGCFVPETPTKLGIWPKYEPKIYLDTTLLTPRMMIQGHDGSQILAYGDQRDEVILELEKRIFNNIKVTYDSSIFDINDIIPSYNRNNDYSREELNEVLAPEFYKWAKIIGQDFTKSLTHDINNSFTYNYTNNEGPDGSALPGYWRGVYRWLFDTDRPHICPWEMLGFSVEPAWWQSVYGPAPYTNDNRVMWQDLADGLLKEPGTPVTKLAKYVRPYLMDCIPTDEFGNLISPMVSGAARGTITNNINLDYVFGDVGPVEAAWRRSSHYAFSVIVASMKLTPAKTFGLLLDRSRIKRNLANQIVYTETNLRIRPRDIVIPSTYTSNIRVQTSGIINYVTQLILNYVFSNNVKSYNNYSQDLMAMNAQLSYRVGAFTNKDQFSLLLESKTPSSTGSVFIPTEDYTVTINSSSPVNKLIYSGVVITKMPTGFNVSGYSQTRPYFTTYNHLQNGATVNVGGISESYTVWTPGQQYHVGSIVRYTGKYYRAIVTNTASESFDYASFVVLPALPITGGATAIFRKLWDKTNPVVVPYGTEFNTAQEVVDFLIGYGEWLKDQGFSFNEFNNNLGAVSNWETSAKEFLFWTTQNWSAGEEKWEEWSPNLPYSYGTVVRYDGEFYSANSNIPASAIFDETEFTKLAGLSNYGSSVISLSPAAGQVSFSSPLTVVDDINNRFNSYEFVKVDGTTLHSVDLDSYRQDNSVSYSTKTADGIYGASFYLIQNEHIVILNNKTIFNDVIYSPESGYRQERIKVSGYITNGWNGSLDIPGFVFDQAKVQGWQAWSDYNMGDIVVYQGYYYSANSAIPGSNTFDSSKWTRMDNPPSQNILPNWTNAATQFSDFYSLDVDSFDLQHQQVGQHLIGYQKRQYLNNIIQDDVSEFKFFQGMIREKGTQNVLNKLFNVLGSENKESLKFYEEWALRVGQYGANTAFEQIEFVLDEGNVSNNPQGYVLVERTDKSINHFVNQITYNDVYLKPQGYKSAPWPIVSKFKPLLRSAGYVNSRDTTVSLGYVDEIAGINPETGLPFDPDTFFDGDYISCAFDGVSWDIYRFTDLGMVTVSAVFNKSASTLEVTLDKDYNLQVNQYVAISGFTPFKGFYAIKSINGNSFTIAIKVKGIDNPIDGVIVRILTEQKINSLDDIDGITTSGINLKQNELIWTDNTATPKDRKWASWAYNKVYSVSDVTNPLPSENLRYGQSIAVSKSGDFAATSTSDGQTVVMVKPGLVPAWARLQVIQKPSVSANYTSGSTTGVIDSLDTSGLNSTLSLAVPGTGYLPAVGSVTYYNVPLGTDPADPSTIGAVANITVRNGVVYNIKTISVTAQYTTGTLLRALSSNLGGQGSGFRAQVSNAAGNGYTPLTSTTTYRDVPLTGGNGTGATADITIKNGKVIAALLNQPGVGYQPNDILSADAIYLGGTVDIAFNISVFGVNKNLNSTFATVLAISDDKQWLATGSPTAGYAATKFKGTWSPANYAAGDIVLFNNQYYKTDTAILETYTSVTGTTISQGQGARFTVVVSSGSYFVKVISGGAGYKQGNRIKIVGSQLGGIDSVNDIIITVGETNQESIVDGNITWIGTVPPRSFLSLPGEIILGTGATFTIKPVLELRGLETVKTYTVTVSNVGTGYIAGDKVTILGSSLGGKKVLHDLVITIPETFTIGTDISSNNLYGVSVWKEISYVPTNISGTNSDLVQQGVITIYKKDSSNNYTLVDSIVSPTPSENEKFGSSLAFDDNALYVGATGYSNSTGRVYKLSYASKVRATSAYNPIGSANSLIVVNSTIGILPGMYVRGDGFVSGQYVVAVTSGTTLTLSGKPDSTPTGILEFVTTEWGYDSTEIYTGTVQGANFGHDIQLSSDRSTLVISASGGSSSGVQIYKNNSTSYTLVQTILGEDTAFASSITVSSSGAYIAINNDYSNQSLSGERGVVGIYELINGQYVKNSTAGLGQDLTRHTQDGSLFGSKISFMNDYNTLVVYSFNDLNGALTGSVDIFDKYVSKWVWSETLESNIDWNIDGFGTGFAVGNNQVFIGAPFAQDGTAISGKIYSYNKLPNEYSWKIVSSQTPVVDISKIKKVFLYNKVTGKLITYLDVIDPVQGKIAGPAEEEIKYKTFYDPATYSTGTTTVTVDASTAWNSFQVGTLWWDLRTAKFVDSYDQDLVYRNTTWNMLATGASIDIYEWVESTLKPSQWDAQTDTVAGLANGISGTTLYGDSVYAEKVYFDKISKINKSKYYFWVKNKRVTPSIQNRKMSALDVASLIANPRGQAYSYIAFTGANTFSLVNTKQFLSDKDVVLSVEYWTTDKTDQNIHSQYKIVSTDPSTELPHVIEQKWFDSLCGADTKGLAVPDPSLPEKLRYGVENRPRQSMFVNRFEALKQFVEVANNLLAVEQVASTSDISALESYDKEPSVVKGLYDTVLDTELELPYANVTGFASPKLSPIIVDGKITGVEILTAGKGYLIAPYIKFVGSGTGAIAKAIINTTGQVIGVSIISTGEGYDSNTTCYVRSYSVLVHSDSEADNRWSVYAYDPTSKIWSRTLTQSYDVRNYWTFADWYATGYNQFISPEYAVDTFVDLNTITPLVGNTVKVRNANSGGWLILEKYADVASVDWTASYKVVGIEKGTIQLSSSLYQFSGTSVGYDSSIYDGGSFDIVASIELRIILETLRNFIFVGDLKKNYLELFFDSVRYAFSEQVYLDWIFKTSFVKALHNVGSLDQPATYPVDNLSNFEDYVNEVKPYRTKVREYISNYDGLDNASLPITDFDLQPIYEDGNIKLIKVFATDNGIIADNGSITTYPWKFWLDNAGYVVTELVLVDGGSGYIDEPNVIITSPTGSGATARAFFTNGVINRIVLMTKGSGYLSAPTVIIDGGLGANGKPARAVAIIGDSVVRSTHAVVKFDRLTQTNYITQLRQEEVFTGSGSALQFPLAWNPDIKVGNSTIVVNGIPVLREHYKLSSVVTKKKGFTSRTGLVTFEVGHAPAAGSEIVISYNINEEELHAADRILHHYTPGEGQLGKVLSQLMTGVDYGGVIVNGLGFNVTSGWDSNPYYNDKWDNFDTNFDDFYITVGAGTHSFTMPYVPEAGTEINIYHVKSSVDSYISDGATVEYLYSILSTNQVATATTTVQALGVSVDAIDGSYGTVLKVSNTADIKVGMSPVGNGFVKTRIVTEIIDSTTVSLDGEPDSAPNGELIFTFNYAGSTKLSVASTSLLTINDVLSTTVSAVFTYNTVISSIVDETTVTLSKMLYAAIPDGETITCVRTLIEPNDIVFRDNSTLLLSEPLPAGVLLEVKGRINPTRLDDVNYGTEDQVNPDAIMTTIVANGEDSTFTIPVDYEVADGDEFILRKSTSDGSITPAEADYDTSLTGGDLAYSTATGISADDILVDGDGFVTPTTSPAPEEVVPGQVVDAVAIKVFDRPSLGSATVKVDNYIADGIVTKFNISQRLNSSTSVIVKVVGQQDEIKTINEDFEVDYASSSITFFAPPAVGSIVSIFSLGFNGVGILDLDYFIGDGTTTEFITKASWLESVTSLVYVDGEIYLPDLFKTDGTYAFANAVGLRFANPPAAGSLINFIIVSGGEQTFAITNTEVIPTDGRSNSNGTSTYPLVFKIGKSMPNESNMMVRVNQTILPGPVASYFTIGSNRLNYSLELSKVLPYSTEIDKITVIADGVKLKLGLDYTVDLSGISIKLTRATYKTYSGKPMIVSVVTADSYMYDAEHQTITFSQVYTSDDYVEVFGSYNHDVLDVQRTATTVSANASVVPNTIEYYTYNEAFGGHLHLDREVIDDNYVWVIKDTSLLVPSVDYKLNDDKKSITLAQPLTLGEQVTLMTYGNNILTSGIAYMQFKDMLNRVHFKRLSVEKRASLAQDLRWNDTAIVLDNASAFEEPNPAQNRPGVIEIQGERIEYYAKSGNTLSKLRRGTLGTGVNRLTKVGVYVQDIGPSETIPYNETNVTEQVLSDGTNTVNLNFVPGGFDTSWTYKGAQMTSNDVVALAKDAVEVFVGGYDDSQIWTASTTYSVGTIVHVGSYTYKCVTEHISSSTFAADSANWTFFIGNIRLKKDSYKVHNVNVAQFSPEGDVTLPADFTVDGTTAEITLTNLLAAKTHVVVVKRTGNVWDSKVNIQNDTSKIAEFLKAKPGIWYSDFKR